MTVDEKTPSMVGGGRFFGLWRHCHDGWRKKDVAVVAARRDTRPRSHSNVGGGKLSQQKSAGVQIDNATQQLKNKYKTHSYQY